VTNAGSTEKSFQVRSSGDVMIDWNDRAEVVGTATGLKMDDAVKPGETWTRYALIGVGEIPNPLPQHSSGQTISPTWCAAGTIPAPFGPKDPIIREQLVTMLYRYEQRYGGGFTGSWMFLLDFADRQEFSEWAYEAVCWMRRNHMVEGKGGIDRAL